MFLEKVMQEQRERVSQQKEKISLYELINQIMPSQASFARAIAEPGLSIIAEIKRASPSKGLLAPALEPAGLAQAYAAGGARAISVLTEPNYFKGSAEDLQAVRKATNLPILRKDFICDPYQIWEAAAWGANAVLLIVAALSAAELTQLLLNCKEAKLDALVEIHDAVELETALAAGARIIGVNSRNLRTLQVDKEVFTRLRPLIPPDVLCIAESGVKNIDDLVYLKQLRYDGVLIGETLVKSGDPVRTLQFWRNGVEHDKS